MCMKELRTQQQQIHSFSKCAWSVHQGWTIFWIIKQTSKNLDELRSHRVYFLTIMESDWMSVAERKKLFKDSEIK